MVKAFAHAQWCPTSSIALVTPLTEERRQAKLKKRRQYQSDRTDHSAKKPSSQSATNKPQQPPNKQSVKPPDKKQIKCWNCEKMGHIAANCRKPRRESAGRSHDTKPGGKVDMVQSNLTTDDPMQYLLLDDSDEDTTEVRQVRVHDLGVSLSVSGWWYKVSQCME